MLVQLYFYLFIYRRAACPTPEINRRKRKLPPVSVIICAKDEAENLRKYLPAVLEQDYPDYEVVVVNDCSEDETADLLLQFQEEYSHLKVTTIRKDPKFTHGKKLALTIGIKAATSELLLLTDADCEPASKDWIRYMTRHYEEGAEMVAGAGLYFKEKGLLNLLIRFDTLFIFMQYAGMARSKRPYMGVGRNLSYRKEIFFRNRGFARHLHLRSGDDDLFVSENAVAGKMFIENHPSSVTYSVPKDTFRKWLIQKRRHLTTGRFYQQHQKLSLGLEILSRVLQNISLIALLFMFPLPLYIAAMYSLTVITKGVVFYLVFRRLNEKILFLPSLLIDPFIPFLYSYLHLANRIDRKRHLWQ
jgi:cellulose synthase/poly-beta-1,6-N-acetylglucosamine synthase-like glycosyltransferase